MASTFTTNLRLTKQGDGDNPNTWGQVLNDGVISLIDDAIAGFTTVSIGTAATVTLTENQGSGDQARSAILELKGSVGGTHSAINILIPNNSKTYLVRNSVAYASAGADVIMKVAGQTGVTIPTGGVFGGTGTGTGTSFVLTNGAASYTHNSFKNIVVDETVTIGGKATFKNAVSVSGDTVINGSTVLAGTARLDSTVTVAGAAVFKGDVHVSSKVCASAYYGDGSNLGGLPSMPTGAIIPYGAVTIPSSDYYLCDGTAYSRTATSSATLYGVIGTNFGVGDGSTTFNVPDLRGRFIAGWNAGTTIASGALTSVTVGMIQADSVGAIGGTQAVTLATAQLPAHTHTTPYGTAGSGGGTYMADTDPSQVGTNNTGSTGGGGAHSNIPPVLAINFIIKN